MTLKNVFIFLIFFLVVSISYALELPEEYYKLKAQIPMDSEWGRYYEPSPEGSKENDIKNICAMADILKKYSADSQNIYDEREFVGMVIGAVMQPTEYKTSLNDYFTTRAARDDYDKCLEPKKTYLRLRAIWWKDTSIRIFAEAGVNTFDATLMAEAIYNINKNKTYIKGKKACADVFKKGLFNGSFIYWYFSALEQNKDTKLIMDFHKKYYEKIPAKAFNSYQAYHILHFPAILEPGLKKKIINSFLDRVNNDVSAVFSSDIFKGGGNDAMISFLCAPDLTEDPVLGKKILKFMQINKAVLENGDEGFFRTLEEKQYLIKNAAEIGLSEETKASLEKQISGER